MSNMMNRIANSSNRFQGKAKKVLCVCSAGLLRSPTAAKVLGNEPFNFNTRAAGISVEFALIPVDEVLILWADEIVCMETWQAEEIRSKFEEQVDGIPILALNVEDRFMYNDPELVEQIKEKYVQESAKREAAE